jgi:hypothetical protein
MAKRLAACQAYVKFAGGMCSRLMSTALRLHLPRMTLNLLAIAD